MIPEAPRLDRRGDWQMRLALGINGEKAILTFAVASRLDAFDVAEGHVQQAALAAVHRRKGVGNSGADDFIRGGLGGHAQLGGAQSLEVGGVKADQIALALVEAQNLRRDGLQSQQQLAVVLRHQRNIRPGQLNA